jgi:tRNA (guanine37-N1)-methyltransferase
LLIKAEPVALAVESFNWTSAVVISTDPAGIPFRQADAIELASQSSVVFLCGHYEGIDERVIDYLGARRYSIGDFVLTGGELPALVMADAICRNVPGVLGDSASLAADSFTNGGLSAENYTRPAVWRGIPVPDLLMSGNHAEIAKWRAARAREITRERRPDLHNPID